MYMSSVVINKNLWGGSCLKSESTLHQISPYIGKMKSTMAKTLIETYTQTGDMIYEPFVGSGTVALECLISGRSVLAADINPYAIVLSKAKINPPPTLEEALGKISVYLTKAENLSKSISLKKVPKWVKCFFHPKTLRETLALSELLKKKHEYFYLSCLLGILHHQRPGFLSYPSSHLVPYLRNKKFPKEEYPELYKYRPLAPRLIAKINRVYKRIPTIDSNISKKCLKQDARYLNLHKNSIDAIITSPPYMNALDYARDNRLRLWFLGVDQYQSYDKNVNNPEKFIQFMQRCLQSFRYGLKKGGKCVLVIGEVRRTKQPVNTAQLIQNSVLKQVKGFELEDVIEDSIPDIRRSRRDAKGTKREWIIVFRKSI